MIQAYLQGQFSLKLGPVIYLQHNMKHHTKQNLDSFQGILLYWLDDLWCVEWFPWYFGVKQC